MIPLAVASFLALLLTAAAPASASATADPFAAANKLYFEGRYAEAAAAYEQLLRGSPPSAALHFNLGNAYFKADQKGRAIAAYLRALRLEPREPNVRFNLKFVRQKVTGNEPRLSPAWERALAALTLNEWTALAAGALWLFFLLLALREARPAWRKPLRGYAALAGLAALLFAGCFAVAAFEQGRAARGVVVTTEAIVRAGPLERSPVSFQLRDGSEVIVLDTQEIAEAGGRQTWYQIQDAARRVGWVKQDQVVVVR
jgi:tetratricopeptide (TPR) repeat protein